MEELQVMAEALTQFIENAADEPTAVEGRKVEVAQRMLDKIQLRIVDTLIGPPDRKSLNGG